MWYLAALAALAAWWAKRQQAAKPDDTTVGGLLLQPLVDITCLWCMHVATKLQRPAIGTLGDPMTCTRCGQTVQYVSTDGDGRWWIS
jgi:hypothetical protein